MTGRIPTLVAAAALAFASLAGCGGSARRDECRALSTLLNTAADRIDKAQATPLDPQGLKALAEVLEKSAGEADALGLSAKDIQKLAKDYAALVREVAKTARDMSAAGETGDEAKARAAKEAMEKIVAAEPKLVAEVNKICSAE